MSKPKHNPLLDPHQYHPDYVPFGQIRVRVPDPLDLTDELPTDANGGSDSELERASTERIGTDQSTSSTNQEVVHPSTTDSTTTLGTFNDSTGTEYYQPAHKRSRTNYTAANGNPPARSYIGTYYHDGILTPSGAIDLTIPIDYQDSSIKYFIGQWERGENQKLHLQFFCVFENPVRVTGARRALNMWRGYLNPAKSPETAAHYVTKPEGRVGEIIEHGDAPVGQGRDPGKFAIYEAARNGMSLYELMNTYPKEFTRYHAGVSKIVAMVDPVRWLPQMPEVLIYYGVPGSGKSYKAYVENPGAYRKIMAGKWWDGYNNQKTVIFEEFNPNAVGEMQLPEWLKVLDRYPYRIEVKGGSMQLKASKFIFTTNINPNTWWFGHDQCEAFRRRVSAIHVFSQKYDPAHKHAPRIVKWNEQ